MQENIHEVITRQTKRDTELNTIVVPFHLSSGTENNFWIIFIKKLHLQGGVGCIHQGETMPRKTPRVTRPG